MNRFLLLLLMLDSDTFSQREKAERLLTLSFPMSHAVVVAGAEGITPEVTMRCQRILRTWELKFGPASFVGPPAPEKEELPLPAGP